MNRISKLMRNHHKYLAGANNNKVVALVMSSAIATEQAFSIYYLSECAVTLEFGQSINLQLLDAVSAYNQLLHQQPFHGFNTAIPAYTTLTVLFDPVVVSQADLSGATCFDKVSNYLQRLNQHQKELKETTATRIAIPVCYGSDYGPDLQEVADLHRLSIEEVIEIHSQAVYKVYMIGFVPGFAYLGGLDERLETPRKSSPRKKVPAGSVGIAGMQTGIYPMQTPGGWQLIGRTPVKLFDVNRAQPSLLKAGDEIMFTPITEKEFIDFNVDLNVFNRF
ncbi:5-oxoprolinase subunit PxpB [Mucilaginibacter sp. dw_454]|uniref:5-oxoprolinase subunit PxpB n=1 Tax=Mucilaginibacter sp. dw_454 TaxID=2720079 RepID=UPI0021043804|nr:5-oxoprolinase subunit PxpB [Mucilaginibacter sp. dw_454]